MKTLPCHPCPHSSVCCSWGTSVTATEEAQILAAHGDQAINAADPDDHRTAILGGACVFLAPGGTGCLIHSAPYYPVVCRGFPDHAEDGGPYPGDPTICPEIKP